MSLETGFDATFTATLAAREKQIQQSYRPIIGVHKWFARRPGTAFRSLLLAEFNGSEPLDSSYWRVHELRGVIADPFMGGGTPIFEANRLGFDVIGTDINPMAYWIVRQSLSPLDLSDFTSTAENLAHDVDLEVGDLYQTRCRSCGSDVPVKYFLWVKVAPCPLCHAQNDLFPGYLLAEATRHPRHVVVCSHCGHLNEYDHQPSSLSPEPCMECGSPVQVRGPARRNRIRCRVCATSYAYPKETPSEPPNHRMWAIEYHCDNCKPTHKGRFFKKPEQADLDRFDAAEKRLAERLADLPIPEDLIPRGDETLRLHRWGYRRYRDMFNGRQLLGLGVLLSRLIETANDEVRHALLTVFSDFLRYQNMLCRYDTYALKCQDIFSVHGFPVGLIQCENNLLGISQVGSGSFRHFVEKYRRAKGYCLAPFEIRFDGRQKKVVPMIGERIEAHLVEKLSGSASREALLIAAPAVETKLDPGSLDGVFTDPPYYDNVQYAELMDFCFAWLRIGLAREFPSFRGASTRSASELTGNATEGRGLEHFTQGLSDVFRHYASALKPGAPFVFTFHHNDPIAYLPIVVAILDAGMNCTATLPVPAEMGASLHIARTGSSVLDSVFVCRRSPEISAPSSLLQALQSDVKALRAAGLQVSEGDVRCLLAGHTARLAVNALNEDWHVRWPLHERMSQAKQALSRIEAENDGRHVLADVLSTTDCRCNVEAVHGASV